MKNANFIAIDFETATSQRSACQIGVVVVKGGVIIEKISKFIQPPGNKYSKHCIQVHGITPETTNNSPTFDTLWNEIKEYFEGNFVVAHNVTFDIDVLNKNLNFYNIPHPIFMGTACTYQLSGMSLEDACQTYNIPLCSHHDGVCDAEACANLFLKYLNGELHLNENKLINPEKYNINDSTYINSNLITIENVNYFNAIGYKNFLDECASSDALSCFTDDILDGVPTLAEFENKKFIITGGTIFDRDRAYQIIKKLGGKKSSSVNKSLNYAILGKEPGPKKIEQLNELKKEGHNIKIITDSELVELIKSSLKSILNEN